MVVRVFVPVAVAAVLSIAAVALLATISLAAAAILAGALALAGIVAPWLSAEAASAAERAVRADRAEFTAQALTVLDHAAELRVAGRLDAAVAAAGAASRRAVAAEDRAAARSAWSAATTPFSIGVSVLAALLIGITLYGPDGGAPGAMTPMALVVLVLLPLSAFEAVGPLPAAAQAMTTARAALHRLTELEADTPGGTAANPWARRATRASVNAANNRDEETAVYERSEKTRASDSVTTRVRSADEVAVLGASVPAAAGAVVRGLDGAARGSETCETERRFEAPGPGQLTLLAGSARPGEACVPELPRGRRIAVIGPSGAGKTTLLMTWAGMFDTPRPGVTFFAEDAHLFGTSVLENLRVARGDLTAAEAEIALRAVGLGEWLDGLPEGIHTDLAGGAAAVSGGQRRRILLARALVSPARVLLLDEPTEHLEAEAGARLLRNLLDVDSGLVEPDRIVVVVTHQLPEDQRADTVLRIAASGQVTADYASHETAREAADSADREIPLPSY
ncbi:ATP-binding cassette domain-containing protein [Nocardia asteroides]